ncbi:MAG: hypothetical protein KJO07_06615 [Deltaproteobacteria bacterium]|nr:hypothetical protein [Deltaproteobacteria bacterium]
MISRAVLLLAGASALACSGDVLEESRGGTTSVDRLDQEPLRFDLIAEDIETGYELKVVVLGTARRQAGGSIAPLRVELVAPDDDWEVTPAAAEEVPEGQEFGRVATLDGWPCDANECAQTMIVLFENAGASAVTVDWTIRVRAEVEGKPSSRLIIFPY